MTTKPEQRLICGVDLGIHGSVVFLAPNGRLVHRFAMPVVSHPCGATMPDVCALRECLLHPHAPDLSPMATAIVVMERIGVFAPHARKSILNFGRGTGRTEAVFELMGYAIQLVSPKDWKASILRGTARDKTAALAFARFRWPEAHVGEDHDLADALCLAEYARQKWLGKGETP